VGSIIETQEQNFNTTRMVRKNCKAERCSQQGAHPSERERTSGIKAQAGVKLREHKGDGFEHCGKSPKRGDRRGVAVDAGRRSKRLSSERILAVNPKSVKKRKKEGNAPLPSQRYTRVGVRSNAREDETP